MHLYFSPMSCSVASRIALYEAALEDETAFHEVGLWTKRYDGDADFWAVSAKGQLPALVTREGALLTENAAVLQYIADLAPAAQLAPPPASLARYELQQWLSFIGSELHKQVFAVLYHPQTPPEAKAYARAAALPPRLAHLEAHLATRAYLVGDAFTVADAYLTIVLAWAAHQKVALGPSLAAYQARMSARPAVRRALREELALMAGAHSQ